MEGLIQFAPFWLGYLVFAIVGYWCWEQLFFWLKRGGDVRRFLHMLGAVLLFTPAPVTLGSAYFAPAFIVFPFTLISSGMTDAMYAVTWFLGGLCVGLVILALRQMLVWLRSRQTSGAEE
ncbi:MAG: hypothetical protein KYX62_02280 [Pseudomonadota bacterium]|nr:hypothetical protein [Pseudomonadota bacterium]